MAAPAAPAVGTAAAAMAVRCAQNWSPATRATSNATRSASRTASAAARTSPATPAVRRRRKTMTAKHTLSCAMLLLGLVTVTAAVGCSGDTSGARSDGSADSRTGPDLVVVHSGVGDPCTISGAGLDSCGDVLSCITSDQLFAGGYCSVQCALL